MKDEEIPEEFSEEDITNLLREALTTRLKEKRKVPNKVRLNKAMISTLGEFLTCFKLIGYDLDGNPINMTVYKEKIEKAALDNLFMETVSTFMSERMD
jgi:hypothetical protein